MSNSPKGKELFQVYGDPGRGVTTGYDLTKNAAVRPLILWEDKLLTVDIYAMPGTPMYGHIYCPQCARNGRQSLLTIRQEAKSMNLDVDAMPARVAKALNMTYEELARYLDLGSVNELKGVLSVEKIGCSWEEDPTAKRTFGFATCPWSVVIDQNIARSVPR